MSQYCNKIFLTFGVSLELVFLGGIWTATITVGYRNKSSPHHWLALTDLSMCLSATSHHACCIMFGDNVWEMQANACYMSSSSSSTHSHSWRPQCCYWHWEKDGFFLPTPHSLSAPSTCHQMLGQTHGSCPWNPDSTCLNTCRFPVQDYRSGFRV